jgi:hypothetical protein
MWMLEHSKLVTYAILMGGVPNCGLCICFTSFAVPLHAKSVLHFGFQAIIDKLV